MEEEPGLHGREAAPAGADAVGVLHCEQQDVEGRGRVSVLRVWSHLSFFPDPQQKAWYPPRVRRAMPPGERRCHRKTFQFNRVVGETLGIPGMIVLAIGFCPHS